MLLALFYGGSFAGWWTPTVIYDNFWPLFTVVNYFSFAQVLFLYIKGRFFSNEVPSHTRTTAHATHTTHTRDTPDGWWFPV